MRARDENRGWPFRRVAGLVLCAVALVGLLAIPSDCATPAPRAVTLALQWIPQSQFAGYYMAQEKGIYAKYGLDVTFLQGGPNLSSMDALLGGASVDPQADFATTWLTTGIQARLEKKAIVHLAQLVQRTSLILISKKSSGISDPSQIAGKRVGIWGADFAIPPRALFQSYNIIVEEIPQSASMNLFLQGAIEVASAMWYNEYHLVLNSGIDPDELNTFFLDQYGLNFPEDGIYCREETVEEDPSFCSAFVRASLEGWEYAFAHEEETLDVVMWRADEVHTGTNRVHQKWMLERMRDIIQAPEGTTPVPLGTLNETDFDFVAYKLTRAAGSAAPPKYSEFHRDLEGVGVTP
ncbi:MAG: ABC transporter substrate-binding protein [Coprothermobacterota bacterium]|nr:ABC transporter substrate-binding protein [Coprothermobacterota bacterium]